MNVNAFDAVERFEDALCEYTGAPYAVTTTRCCMALQMALEWFQPWSGCRIVIPDRTYRGVPQAILRSGASVGFCDLQWYGHYMLRPAPVWDYARQLTPGMYRLGEYQCLSFHRSKPLGFTQGGAVLCNNREAARWFKSWRRDGEEGGMIGNFAYMDCSTAAALHANLDWFKLNHPEGLILPNSDYPDLSKTDWNGIWLKSQLRFTDSTSSETRTISGS